MKTGALRKIIEAGMIAKKTDDSLRELGYDETPYFQIYGNITDALYLLFDEHTETFDRSMAYRIIENKSIADIIPAELTVLTVSE